MARTSLTDMQRVILAGAAMRLDLKVLPVPRTLQQNKGAIELSLRSLLTRTLLGEVPAAHEDAVWREDAGRGQLALIITPAGMAAIGVAADGETADEEDPPAPQEQVAVSPRLPRAGSKLAQLVATLRQPSGATIPDLMEVTGWQAHSVRGAMSGALQKQLGLHVVSELVEGRGRVYRLEPGGSGEQRINAASAEAGATDPVR